MAQITIIVDDKTVIVGGRAVVLPDLDWSKFNGADVHDKIHAVQFDSERGAGHVEYCDVVTEPATRPNHKPHNWLIDAATFEKLFSWVLPSYAEQCAKEDAAQAYAETEVKERVVSISATPGEVENLMADMKARLAAAEAKSAEQHAENKRLAAISADTAAKLDAIISEVSKETSRAN